MSGSRSSSLRSRTASASSPTAAAEETSRALSWLLRHRPDRLAAGLTRGGWARIDDVALALRALGHLVDAASLIALAGSDARRYELDGDRIRARHGHSVAVDLDHPIVIPPDVLFHGTPMRNVASIRARGLVPGKRRSVHLSATIAQALQVGARRGEPICVGVHARRAHDDGIRFARVADGDVWLVDAVAPSYLVIPSAKK